MSWKTRKTNKDVLAGEAAEHAPTGPWLVEDQHPSLIVILQPLEIRCDTCRFPRNADNQTLAEPSYDVVGTGRWKA